MVSFDRIDDYEAGKLDEQQSIELFQDLINDGIVWVLQGSYGRQAKAYIDAGLCFDH